MLSQHAKEAYETNLESPITDQAVKSNEVRLRKLPVHGGVG